MMKLVKCLFVLFCVSMFCQTSEAQLFRGRLMQKIRDDISGVSREKAEQKKALEQQAKHRQQELARQRKAQQSRKNAKAPTPAQPNTPRAHAPSQQAQQQRGRQYQQSAGSNRSASSNRDSQRYQKALATGVPKFGMTVQEQKDGSLVVAQVHPRGNAAQAGIRPGDLIAEIGSVEPGSKKEYQSIVDIMSEGDQMEFVINRRGKKNKLMVQYGDLPERVRNAEPFEGAAGPAIVAEDVSSSRSSRSSVDFVPKGDSHRSTQMNSVIDRDITQYSRRTTGRQLSPQDQEIMRLRAEIERLKQSSAGPSFVPAPSREPVGPRIGQ